MNEKIYSEFIPNYKKKCGNCEQTPTVDIKEIKSGKVIKTGLCGVCTWGEAELRDPDKW